MAVFKVSNLLMNALIFRMVLWDRSGPSPQIAERRLSMDASVGADARQ